ncbi:MAG: TonB-dependent receptor, partial [Acidobacteria bacterium]|nr:TonB-dependent receptor [Acidobacteriota bacterium]
MFRTLSLSFRVLLGMVTLAHAAVAGEKPEKEPVAADSTESRKRVELNLVGKVDTGAGESRRNENLQFNLIDNNALKELNVRLGATATLVEYYRPERSYFSSEFGNAPSAMIAVPPFASAKWHGMLFATHENSIFKARSFFQAGGVKPEHDNREGFRFGLIPWHGGYASLEGSLDAIRGSVNGNVLVPTASERTALATEPQLRALVTHYLAGFPMLAPNRTDINPRALNTNAPQRIDGRDATARLSHDVTARDRVLASVQFTGQAVEAFQFVAGQNPNTDTKSDRARLSWLRQWSPDFGMVVSAALDRLHSRLTPDATSPGPTLAVSGLQTLGPLASIPIDRALNTFHYEGGITRILRQHTLTAGAGVIRRQDNGIETDCHRGYYSFSFDFDRSGIDNFRYGTPTQYIISVGDVNRGFRQWLPQFYIGDDWKAATRLTVHFGVRYEPAGKPSEVLNRNRIPYACDCNNVAPRLGLAYRLPERWGVLRAAYGLHYGDIFPVTYSQIRYSPPGSEKLVLQAPDMLDPLNGLKHTGERPDVLGNRYLLDPGLVTPYSQQYNFSWEPNFSSTWKVQVGYVGSRSNKLLIMWYKNRGRVVKDIPQTTATINQRRADPALAEIRYVLNGSRGYFDAARVTLIAPRFHGFSLDTAYWFSKAIDLGADYTNTAYDADSRLSRSQSEFETHRDRRAVSRFNQPHAFLTRASYELPAHWRGRAGGLVNSWNLSAVALLKNGTPFTVTTPDGPGYGNVDGNGGDRPNLLQPSILGRTVGDPDTSAAMLPASAFSFMAPTDAGGNLGVNTFRRGGIHNLNAALTKSWHVHAEARLTLRAE